MLGPKHRVSTGPKQRSTIQFLKQLTLMLAMRLGPQSIYIYRLGLQIFKTVAKTAVLRKVIDKPLGAVVQREIE